MRATITSLRHETCLFLFPDRPPVVNGWLWARWKLAAVVSAVRSRFQNRVRAVGEVAEMLSCGLPAIADSLSIPCAFFCCGPEQE